MGYTCDFCSQQRSLVYCRSDSACLCLSCDRQVHSANALSRRHSRTLLCERCSAHAAVFRCVEEKICLCQNCDSSGHRPSTSASTHKRQTINCYSGCPSPAEFSTFWSFFSNVTAADDSSCEHGLSLMSISKDSVEDCLVPADTNSKDDGTAAVEVNNVLNLDNSSVWTGSCSITHPHCAPDSVDEMARSLLAGSPNSTLPKMQLPYPGTKGFGHCKDDDLYEDLNMDEVDLNFENYEELFGVALSHSEQLLENGGFDSLFGTKDMSGANSHCQGAAVSEDASGEVVKSMQPACSNGASVDSVMSSKTEPTHCFTSRPVQSALSFSGLTGECSAGDYQDCGASSMLLMGEPQWCPPCSESSLPSSIRSSAVMRYKEKKKTRKFEKKVRYASRKARADVRKRVKGRFVKTGDAYDYDPLTQTRSY